ncbi:CobW family GTP-binding protein [Neisseria sp. Ec49-e6-T10]|uniref:CobW family GTP-binding protein n=1 Tax=Neisseria sp. Ec49-e6-T10 TaxID=3140744 RepID=UPI003EBE1F06
MKNVQTHLFTGFLGTGKTTALRHLLTQKPQEEKWAIIVNEFGDIGIDGAVLSNNEVPVAEIAGGCLCCVAGPQMTVTVNNILKKYRPHRLLIEASGLAHAASVIDELQAPYLIEALSIGANVTLVDPRQFVHPDYAKQALYRDQISIADILIANKVDLCDIETLSTFRRTANQLFPPKSLIKEVTQGKIELSWLLDTQTTTKSRYRLKGLAQSEIAFQSEGFIFDPKLGFHGERLTQFFDELPTLCEGLVRAKGIFKVLGTWVWLNWAEGYWGANQVAWRKDSRFELIAKKFDAELIANRLQECVEE